mmetsp:Transcript_29688/g.45269  ORF Transcript_29688/g.45269 Transcript_29688/m.45269 type:complete len:347 (+) Transcript_29688:103-1143(+)
MSLSFGEDFYGASFTAENKDLADRVHLIGVITISASIILMFGMYLYSGCDIFKLYKFISHRDLGWIVYMSVSASVTLLSYSFLVDSFWVGLVFNYLATLILSFSIMNCTVKKISRAVKATSWPVELPKKIDTIETTDVYDDLQGTTFGQSVVTITVQGLLLFVFVTAIISKGTADESTLLVPSTKSFLIYCLGFFVQQQYYYTTINRQIEENTEFWYKVALLEFSPVAKAEGYQGFFNEVVTLGKGKGAITKKIHKWEIWARCSLHVLANGAIQSLIAALIPVEMVLTENQEELLLNVIAAYFISNFSKLARSSHVTVSRTNFFEDDTERTERVVSSEPFDYDFSC